MLGYHDEQRSLTRKQKEAIGLLSIGTFLEYFDLMLYVHMAVLLNDLFFPKSDPKVASLLSAAAFCSTYVLRPFAAFILGWIGDNIGRKSTVIITTFIMAISCLVMANLSTFEEKGIIVSWIMIICRMSQGVSSMGEIVGAELYITETTKPPAQYIYVGIILIASLFGGMAALAFGVISANYLLNWRYAFWGGAIIALVGLVARTRLRESTEFVDAKRRIKNTLEDFGINTQKLPYKEYIEEKVNKKTALAYFLVVISGSACFYLIYVHCASLLKTNFNYSPAEVMKNNFYVSVAQLVLMVLLVLLTLKFPPLKILKVRAIMFLVAMPISIYFLNNATTDFDIFKIQILLIMTSITTSTATPIILKSFPVFKRFTYSTVLYAFSTIFIYAITSFGMVFLVNILGTYSILLIMMPVGIAFYWGVTHFELLEKLRGNYQP
ncbi:MFS transporter [Rickettsia endosymbiont of Halotydeus destructor]|uniref:MFS transporter n=1 Tax=Rickettsia endosymbiont of Halotydeus destructor TaxID=2996754 RepID=UPI003BAEF0F0